MSSDPHAVVLLVGMGIRKLSMSAAQLAKIKWLIRAMDAGYARCLYEVARQSVDGGEIRKITTEYLSGLDFPGIK
jgi:signal transduction protein with GAF and PtsI domain